MCTNPLNDYFAMAGHNPRFASNSTALRRWVQLHGKRGDTPAAAARLLPMMIAAAPTAVSSAPRAEVAFEIELAGTVVRVREGVAPSWRGQSF